jgi:membrane protease subunit HflC
MPRVLLIIGIPVIVALIASWQSLFFVDETEVALVTRFGQFQGAARSPGLQFKIPFIVVVTRFDRRLLHIDVRPTRMQDVDTQFLEIDAYVRYRIVDAKQFRRRLTDELTASARIENIVISEIRQEIARSNRQQIIGGGAVEETIDPETGDITRTVTPLLTAEGLPVRAAIMQRVRDRSDAAVKSVDGGLGVTVVDVRMKAADFPEAVEQSVFTQMRTERLVQADRLRAEGEQESITIRADVDRQVTIIVAEAERDAQTLRGEGEGEAIRLLAKALERDPEFFAFRRSLQAYQTFLNQTTTLVLPADSDLFRYLQSAAPPTE